MTGPAGSGKTVLVRDWAAVTGGPTAWLALDPSHSDPEHFLEALLAALEEVAPGLHDATWRNDPGDHAADHAVVRAIDHLRTAPPSVVVLDDLHTVDRSPTTALLARLVEVIPENLTLVVCSRTDPPLPLHRFRLAGELVELRESDLRFDADEAALFFERFPQLTLEEHHVERLAERTEGWVAGLQFAALSLAGRDDTDAFVERFAGSDRHVADFLLDEVLDRQPDHVRDFLLATSVLDRVCAPLCEHVTGRPDAADLLRRIEHDHLFLLPLDRDRDWFRYHHLFGQLLRRELRMTRPELERQGHERAAVWYAAHDQPDLAIDHLLDAGDAFSPFESYPLEVWRRTIDVNLTGTFLVAREAGRALLESGGGSLVTVSSIYGVVGPDHRIYDDQPFKSFPGYSASKAGVIGLTRWLATWWARKGIRVNCVVPGGVFDGHDPDDMANFALRVRELDSQPEYDDQPDDGDD